jgi:hypothetical protein
MKTNEWQPIETAPKDGTRVILLERDTHGERGRVFDGCWLHGDGWPSNGGLIAWMPLPSPPSGSDQ